MTVWPQLLLLAGACALGVALLIVLHRSGTVTRRTAMAVAVACAVAWLANALVTSWYFVDVLRLDAWETVGLVERSLNGTLRLADLWAPHNEHRPLTGRLVALASARWSHWNHWWEFAALHAVAGLQVVVLAAYVAAHRRTWRVEPLVFVAAAACFLATIHWETWLRGFSVHILLGVLGPTLALFLLCRCAAGWASLALAILAAIVGLAVGLVASALYLPGLQVHPGATANLDVALGPLGLARMAAGVLVTLGMAMYYAPSLFDGGAPWQQVAVVISAGVGVMAWTAVVALRWRQDHGRERVWLFPAALGLFGLGACLLTSAGRVSGGLLALAASRYLIFAACFWSSLLLLIGLHTDARGRWAHRGVVGVALAVIVAMVAASMAAIPYMADERSRVRGARLQLLQGDVGAAAVVLYPDPFKLQHMRDVLRQHRLSVFRQGAR
jgi:hypothetical protein